jgi:cell division septum initiation protein DivIVA
MDSPPLDPSEIHVRNLPRARMGGYATEETEELLTRVAWTQRELRREAEVLSQENAKLTERVAELEQREAELTAKLEQREAELTAELERREAELTAELEASEARAERAGDLVAVARRAALETREAAREEAEIVLRKVRKRADQLEHAVQRMRAAKEAELLALRDEEARVRERLRSYLTQTLAAVNGAAPPALSSDLSPVRGRDRNAAI